MDEILIPVMLVLFWLLVKFLRREAVFVPLPMGTVRKILDMAKVKKSDTVYDLGSGDGRIVIAAAKERGAKAVGIEVSGFLCRLSEIMGKGLKNKIKIIHGDLFGQDFSDATVITVYLTQKLNDRLEPRLKKLKKGTRIVSADHTFKGIREVGRSKAGHLYLRLYRV